MGDGNLGKQSSSKNNKDRTTFKVKWKGTRGNYMDMWRKGLQIKKT